jgi:glycosyl transferase family 25
MGGLLPMSLPYDHAYDKAWVFGLKLRLVTPTPCGHDDQVASTIGAPGQGAPRRKFHWTKRLSTYRYRLGNEWRRLVYGLTSTWRERRGG